MIPNVPTAHEAGYPSLDFDRLVGLFSTRELSEDARTKIAADIKSVAGDPTIVQKMTATAQIGSPGNAKEFAESIA